MLKYNAEYNDIEPVETVACVEADYRATIDFDIVRNARGEKTIGIILWIGDSKKITILTREEALGFIDNLAFLLNDEPQTTEL